MELGFVFFIFLQKVALGAGTVFALLLVISLCTRPRAAVALIRPRTN
jgi:hypothetical protein